MLVPDWHTFLMCSGGGGSLVRTLPVMPGSVAGVLPSAKQHRWMSSFRPIQRQNAADGTLWLVSGCFRAPFPSGQAFVLAEGTIEDREPWARTVTVDATAFDAIPVAPGLIEHYRPLPQRTLIRWSGSGEYRMVVGPGMALGIDSEATFNSHCFDWGEVQTVDQATFNAHGVMGILHNGANNCSADDRIPMADGFDYTISPYAVATRSYTSSDGSPDRYYLAQGFRAYNSSTGYHDGEDWNGDGGGNTDCGDAVYAPANGKIVNRQNSASGWGNALVIEHRLPDGRRTQTVLAHHESLIRTHGVVRRGELVATVGTTGNSSACHLHWGHRNPGDPSWNQFGAGYSFSTTYPYMEAASQFVDRNRTLTVP
ncbi:MAG TPA: M23 family metallopeptidase [Longimicrobiaceae bacterium]